MTLHRAWVLGPTVILLLAGCISETPAEADMDPDCPAALQASWPEGCRSGPLPSLALSGCLASDQLIWVPLENSQVPPDWTPFTVNGALAQFAVLTYTCDQWSADGTDLGRGALSIVAEYVTIEGETSTDNWDLYVFHAFSDNPAVEYFLDRHGLPSSAAAFEHLGAPLDPHSYQFQGENVSYSAAMPAQDYTIEGRLTWRLHAGTPDESRSMALDSMDHYSNSITNAIVATGGVFDAALPAPSWTAISNLRLPLDSTLEGHPRAATHPGER